MPAFDGATLKARLTKLDGNRQLAFGAFCCERLVPNYIAFQQDTDWGDFSSLRKALDIVWKFLSGESVSVQEIKNATQACELAAPSSDDFASLYVSSAQDACFSVCSLLDHLRENNVGRIVQAATYATDSVDLYIQEIEGLAPSDLLLDNKILVHPLMQRELTQQQEDLKAIEKTALLNVGFFVQQKASWNNAKSNLDLP
ncbi:DUF416 family protein [Chitinimonas arctica]|nr:DUF416 family protein [Chitinimonas arctica]